MGVLDDSRAYYGLKSPQEQERPKARERRIAADAGGMNCAQDCAHRFPKHPKKC
jgi:hypothetical protein